MFTQVTRLLRLWAALGRSRKWSPVLPLSQLSSRFCQVWGFFGGAVGKESTCNAGDPGLIPGSARSPGEAIGYLPRYSWASLVDQTIKNLPIMQDTWVQSLGWEDPLEEGMAFYYYYYYFYRFKHSGFPL